jgi:hypothetical protein
MQNKAQMLACSTVWAMMAAVLTSSLQIPDPQRASVKSTEGVSAILENASDRRTPVASSEAFDVASGDSPVRAQTTRTPDGPQFVFPAPIASFPAAPNRHPVILPAAACCLAQAPPGRTSHGSGLQHRDDQIESASSRIEQATQVEVIQNARRKAILSEFV